MDDKLKVDEYLNNDIRNCIGKNLKFNGIKRFVKYEIKNDKYENRLFFLDDYRIYLMSLNKFLKPTKVEAVVHVLEIKRIESLSKSQLYLATYDNREFRLSLFSEDDISCDAIDDVLYFYCKLLRVTFPMVSVKDIIDSVNIMPEKRWKEIENFYTDIDSKLKHENLCGSYERAYLCYCDLFASNTYAAEVVWDVNLIYTLHNSKEFRLNDFDYVNTNTKETLSILTALRYNQWFESLYCEDIKLVSELQDEIQRLLSSNLNKIKSINLQHCNIKSDFLQKQLNTLQQFKAAYKQNYKYTLNQINLSRNTIEDKGAMFLANILREFTNTGIDTKFTSLSLSKCLINSKGINSLGYVLKENFLNSLTYLDLSYNTLKDDPVELFRYLSERNSLSELNLTGTDIDLEKLFIALNKGCEANLKKLQLSNNTNHSKNFNFDSFVHFFNHTQLLEYLDMSNCKLTGLMVQNLLICLQTNSKLKDFYLNLSSNDLGSCIRQFMNDVPYKSCIKSLDLSDNNFEADFDIFLNELSNSCVEHLWLSKNFVNIKPKYIRPIINSLVKLVSGTQSKIESLWLIDCRLRSNLIDFLTELESCSTLKYLDISGNDLGDFGINLLAKSLQVNRSIETLLLDRSNITANGLDHIIEAIKRNYTLKTIQIPFTDICNLYQKTPEKVIDTVKQMNDLLAQRNTNYAANKCNIEQLLKTKLKLLNEPNEKLNDLINATANHKENQLDLKEVLQTLNETTIQYINENPIDREFNQYKEQILEKFNLYTNNLQTDLNEKIKSKYNLNTTAQEFVDTNVKLNNLKKTINDSMNSLLNQMHNEFCEIAYQLSSTMAEKTLQNASQAQQSLSVSTVSAPSNTKQDVSAQMMNGGNKSTNPSTPIQPVINMTELSRFSFKNNTKNPVNNSNSDSSTTTSLTVQATKSKRPISSQLHDLSANDAVTTSNANKINQMTATSALLNENIGQHTFIDPDSCHVYADIIDDMPALSENKMPEQNLKHNEPTLNNETYFVLEDSVDLKDSSNSETTPRPAPRRVKPLPKQPPLPQIKTQTESAKWSNNLVNGQASKKDDTLHDANDAVSSEPKKLEHLNKSRPKRANVKKPTRNNASNKIETVELNENLIIKEEPVAVVVPSTPVLLTNGSSDHAAIKQEITPQQQIANLMSTSMIVTSSSIANGDSTTPKLGKPQGSVKNGAEQIKISLNILENVKLRKTAKATPEPPAAPPSSTEPTNKTPEEPAGATVTSNTTPVTTNVNLPAPGRFANRHSSFLSSATKFSYAPTAPSPASQSSVTTTPSTTTTTATTTQTPTISEHSEEVVNGVARLKVAPPIPPLKPPKPLPNKTASETTPQQSQSTPTPLVRLKPVNKDNNTPVSTTATSQQSTSSSTSSSTSTESAENPSALLKPPTRVPNATEPSTNNDKRSSVREIVQMLSEESKLRSATS